MSAHKPFLHVREARAVCRPGASTCGIWHHDSPDADPFLRTHEGIVRGRCAPCRAALESSCEALKARAHEVAGARRLPEAAALWSQAHAVLPHDPEPVLAYAEIALAAGDAAAARAAIENGLALMPDEAFLHRALAALLHRGGDEDGARRELAVAERCARGAMGNEAG